MHKSCQIILRESPHVVPGKSCRERQKTVAEGVETQAQLKLLQELGCDLGQGFYFQKASTGEMISQCYERGLPLGRAQTL